MKPQATPLQAREFPVSRNKQHFLSMMEPSPSIPSFLETPSSRAFLTRNHDEVSYEEKWTRIGVAAADTEPATNEDIISHYEETSRDLPLAILDAIDDEVLMEPVDPALADFWDECTSIDDEDIRYEASLAAVGGM